MANIYQSKYKDVEIPEISITEFTMSKFDGYGDKVALVDGGSGRELTYKQLASMCRKFSAGLHKRGFKHGDAFLIFAPNMIEYPVAVFGVAALGGIVSSANVLYTADELVHQIKNSKAIYVLTISMFYDKVKEAIGKVNGQVKEVFTFDKCEGATPITSLLEHGEEFPPVSINSKKDTLALPYSSGTTGFPKGVVLTHFNLISNIVQYAHTEKDDMLKNPENEVLIGVLPFFHIYGFQVILHFGLHQGMKIIVMPKFELEHFLSHIQKYKVMCCYIVPPIAVALAKHPLVDKYDLSSVKILISGAAPLGGDIEKAIASRLKVPMKQGYGMTELSPVSHFTPTDNIKSGSSGILLPNCIAKIRDIETGESLPVGKDGELCVKGPNVMVGYLNNAEATANTIDSEGWLHTGDIAHVDEEGYFYIVDRLKELIKYNGYQVPPAELEALLLTHNAIADCAVIPKPDEKAGEVPKAFVVLKPNAQATEEEIVNWIKDKVAIHKHLRGGVEFVAAIPKSASGKILRRILVDQERRKAQQQ